MSVSQDNATQQAYDDGYNAGFTDAAKALASYLECPMECAMVLLKPESDGGDKAD